ncbi:TIGR03089 family protein [Oerskovia merdavium]|uniref:TIGR03089 family protein n=1 Tax=Oerskovia merdavium TaxID=2762227 RepID=A0ABR8TU44_9CELL|nr:TIGR03089 family protein [Oerskovia merdavium]MBD7979265.1 TIGR03089 family protein [Oerskovia merdavium]
MAPSPAPVAHVADLQRLIIRDPGRPRVTWYGDDGERVELSGAVLHNWINKTVNLLVEEFDAAPGTRVVLDLPPHWRAIVWGLAAWRTGATLVLLPDTPASGAVEREEEAGAPALLGLAHDADVVVTSRPAAWAGTHAPVVAVPLPALARRFDGDLPAGAIDAGSAVMTYGDQIGWVEEVDPDAVALEPGAVLHGELVTWASRLGDDVAPGSRDLVQEGDASRLLRRTLQVLAVDGSVVVLSPALTTALAQDPERLSRLRTSERVDL